MMKNNIIRLPPSSMAWLGVFVPAFLYYMTTRLYSWGLFRSASVGTQLPFMIVGGTTTQAREDQCRYLANEVFARRILDCSSTNGGGGAAAAAAATAGGGKVPGHTKGEGRMYQILQEQHDIVATTWKHDEELGRGYLLISTSQGKGKIWQWETGGGPIPIGRTLHMLDSGCRSRGDSCRRDSGDDATTAVGGSGGMAVDVWHEPQPRLIVAEWGERRIVRLEPESGARTPLIVQYYDDESSSSSSSTSSSLSTPKYPVQQPRQLLLTAFGDLLILDTHRQDEETPMSAVQGDKEDDDISHTTIRTSNILWQLPRISQIPPLRSLAESREAHAWTSLPKNTTTATAAPTRPKRIVEHVNIGGVALVPKEWFKLYMTMEVAGNKVVLLMLTLENDDVDDQEQVSPTSEILLDYSEYASQPGPVTVDDLGRLYLAVDHGLLIVELPPTGPVKIVGHIVMPNVTDSIVTMTLGGDRFLYLASAESLYRVKMRNKPMSIPLNLVLH